jgi:hypothetical protein
METKVVVCLSVAFVFLTASAAFAQLTAEQSVRLDSVKAGIHRAAAISAELARGRARDAKLAALFAAAPQLTSTAALSDSWVMAEPGRDGRVRIEGNSAKVDAPAYNGIDIGATGSVTVADGEARFAFPAAASSISDNDMDGRYIPIQTTAADYRCKVLGDRDLMVCLVSYLPAHQDLASVVREQRYEGFSRDGYTQFR